MKIKKIIALILSLTIILSCIPAYAADTPVLTCVMTNLDTMAESEVVTTAYNTYYLKADYTNMPSGNYVYYYRITQGENTYYLLKASKSAANWTTYKNDDLLTEDGVEEHGQSIQTGTVGDGRIWTFNISIHYYSSYTVGKTVSREQQYEKYTIKALSPFNSVTLYSENVFSYWLNDAYNDPTCSDNDLGYDYNNHYSIYFLDVWPGTYSFSIATNHGDGATIGASKSQVVNDDRDLDAVYDSSIPFKFIVEDDGSNTPKDVTIILDLTNYNHTTHTGAVVQISQTVALTEISMNMPKIVQDQDTAIQSATIFTEGITLIESLVYDADGGEYRGTIDDSTYYHQYFTFAYDTSIYNTYRFQTGEDTTITIYVNGVEEHASLPSSVGAQYNAEYIYCYTSAMCNNHIPMLDSAVIQHVDDTTNTYIIGGNFDSNYNYFLEYYYDKDSHAVDDANDLIKTYMGTIIPEDMTQISYGLQRHDKTYYINIMPTGQYDDISLLPDTIDLNACQNDLYRLDGSRTINFDLPDTSGDDVGYIFFRIIKVEKDTYPNLPANITGDYNSDASYRIVGFYATALEYAHELPITIDAEYDVISSEYTVDNANNTVTITEINPHTSGYTYYYRLSDRTAANVAETYYALDGISVTSKNYQILDETGWTLLTLPASINYGSNTSIEIIGTVIPDGGTHKFIVQGGAIDTNYVSVSAIEFAYSAGSSGYLNISADVKSAQYIGLFFDKDNAKLNDIYNSVLQFYNSKPTLSYNYDTFAKDIISKADSVRLISKTEAAYEGTDNVGLLIILSIDKELAAYDTYSTVPIRSIGMTKKITDDVLYNNILGVSIKTYTKTEELTLGLGAIEGGFAISGLNTESGYSYYMTVEGSTSKAADLSSTIAAIKSSMVNQTVATDASSLTATNSVKASEKGSQVYEGTKVETQALTDAGNKTAIIRVLMIPDETYYEKDSVDYVPFVKVGYILADIEEIIENPTYSITINLTTENGTLTADKTTAYEGDIIALVATPDSGYKVLGVSSQQVEVNKVDDTHYGFTMPASDVTIYGSFEKIEEVVVTTYAITASSNDSSMGSVSVNKSKAAEGDIVTVTVSPKTDYKFDGFTNTDIDFAQSDEYVYWFNMPAKDIEINGQFSLATEPTPVYTITNYIGADGTITADKTTASALDLIHLTVTPADGYVFEGFNISGVTVNQFGDVYFFQMPANDLVLSGTFTLAGSGQSTTEYSVYALAGSGGTVSSSVTKAKQGSTVVITATPNSGYEVDKISSATAGVSFVKIDKYRSQFVMPASNVIVNVTFKAQTVESSIDLGDVIITNIEKDSTSYNGTLYTGLCLEEDSDITNIDISTDLAYSLLTEAEKAILNIPGNNIYVYLVCKPVAFNTVGGGVTLDELSQFVSDNGITLAKFYDYSLYKKVNNEAATQITDISPESIVADIAIPSTLINADPLISREFSVYTLHDDTIKTINTSAIGTNLLRLSSLDQFSIYILAYKDTVHTHTYAEAWTHDEDYHWHAATCEHASEVSEKAAHTFDSGVITTPATDEDDGVKTYTCTVCQYQKTEVIQALDHTHTYSDEWSYDEDYHWHAATCKHTTLTKDKALHNFGEAIVITEATTDHAGQQKYVCSDCGYEKFETIPQVTHEHTYSDEWSSNAIYHWHAATCEHTTLVADKALHTYGDPVITKEATTTETGIKVRTCSVCGYERQEVIPKIDPDNPVDPDEPDTEEETEETYNPYQDVEPTVLPETYRNYPPVVDGGDAHMSPENPKEGDTVILTVDIEEGMTIDKVTVTTKSGKSVAVTQVTSTRYKFTQPAENTTVTVETSEVQTEQKVNPNTLSTPYTDVSTTAWYYSAVTYCTANKLIESSSNEFGVNDASTRAQMITALYKLAGSPKTEGTEPYQDIDSSIDCYNAVVWAVNNGITAGATSSKFYPDRGLSRQELAKLLYQYAEYKHYDITMTQSSSLVSFSDEKSIDNDAFKPLQWAVGHNLLHGDGNKIRPKDTATKAELASALYNLSLMTSEYHY